MALEMYMVIVQGGGKRAIGGVHGNVRYLYGPLQ